VCEVQHICARCNTYVQGATHMCEVQHICARCNTYVRGALCYQVVQCGIEWCIVLQCVAYTSVYLSHMVISGLHLFLDRCNNRESVKISPRSVL